MVQGSPALVPRPALLAGAVWLYRRLRPRRGYLPYPVRVGGTVLITVTAMVAWLGFAFGEWLVIIAAVPLAAAAGLEISARRHARQETRATAAAPAAPAGARGYAPQDGNGSAASASESREPGLAGSR